MKKTPFTLTALLALAMVAGVQAADTKNSARTEVTFSNPDKFADAAEGPRGTDMRRDAILDQIRDYLVKRADIYVPEGQKLSVTVTDVDLAGEVEPWRTRGASDTRFVRDIYPPKIDLSFRLTDANGAVIKEGKRHLTDLTFNMNINPNQNDPRVYENRLIDDWLRREFGRAKKK